MNQQKTEIMINIITDVNLLKAIVNKPENFLELDLPIEIQNDPSIIFYDNVFPYKYPSIVLTEEKVMVSFGFGNYTKYNNVFKIGRIDFLVFVHKELLKTDVGLRMDYIINRLDILFNSNENIGIGVLEFQGFDDLQLPATMSESYVACVISYKILDHN